jgi:hypothetical protein
MESRATTAGQFHVYVVELRQEAARRSTQLPPVYVGQTAHSPEQRFADHLRGYKASRKVHRYGARLRPDLSAGWRPYSTRDEAVAAEARLAKELSAVGYEVFGGH